MSSQRISGSIDVKRFYLSGFKLVKQCPKCGKDVRWIGDDDYVSFPELNKPIKIDMYCRDEWQDEEGCWQACGEEWE